VPDTDLWPVLEGRVGGALREQMVGFCAAVRAGAAVQNADADAAVEGLRIAEAILQACATRQPVVLDEAAA